MLILWTLHAELFEGDNFLEITFRIRMLHKTTQTWCELFFLLGYAGPVWQSILFVLIVESLGPDNLLWFAYLFEMYYSVDLTCPKNLLDFDFNEETGMLIFLWILVVINIVSTNRSIAIICINLKLVVNLAKIKFENGHAWKFKWRSTI